MELIKLLKIMKKHKICIIGDGLSGLIAAKTLGKLNIEIDFISQKSKSFFLYNRTTAISPSNYKFISENLFKKKRNPFYECKKISLYHEKKKDCLFNFMNFENSNKGLMYIVENKHLRNALISNIKKNKQIKRLKANVEKIDHKKTSIFFKNKEYFYDMILLCTGKNKNFVKKLIGKRLIVDNKNETAFTCIINHDFSLTDSKQFFLKEGPMAILPISDKKFSLIWSMNANFNKQDINNIKKLILLRLKKIFPKNSKIRVGMVNKFPIHFTFNRNFFNNNIFAIGESAYNVYPIAGQGFNLVLRDIEDLYKKIQKNISLGIQLKDSLIFNDLYLSRKPENFLYGLGINLTQNFFRHSDLTLPIKNRLLKDIGKFAFLKKIGLKIADRGIIN